MFDLMSFINLDLNDKHSNAEALLIKNQSYQQNQLIKIQETEPFSNKFNAA